jgi:hypothetical protein
MTNSEIKHFEKLAYKFTGIEKTDFDSLFSSTIDKIKSTVDTSANVWLFMAQMKLIGIEHVNRLNKDSLLRMIYETLKKI